MVRAELLDAICRLAAVRHELLHHVSPDSCIETSRVVQLLLREEGLPAHVVPVEARVANAPATKFIIEGNARALRERQDGAHVVIVGAPARPQPGRWAGHLAVLCENVLIDASLDQANRPRHGILFPSPFVVQVGGGFRRAGGRALTHGEDGVLVEYIHHPRNRSYLQTPAWRKAHLLLRAARAAFHADLQVDRKG